MWIEAGSFLGVRFVHHRAEQVEIHPVKGVARHTGFEDSLDRIHAFRRQLIDLLARFLLGLRDAQKLRIETGPRESPAFASSTRCRVRLPR